jgi:hypothetical protein
MNNAISRKAADVILQDAIQRDITTARRFILLQILWNERYLTRAQLITRMEYRLGKNCAHLLGRIRSPRHAVLEGISSRVAWVQQMQEPSVTTCRQFPLSPEFKQLVKVLLRSINVRSIFITSCRGGAFVRQCHR